MARLDCPKCSRPILQCTSAIGTTDVVYVCGCGYRLKKSYDQIREEDRRILELKLNKIRNCPDEYVEQIEKRISVKVTYNFGEVWKYTINL